MDLLFSRSQDFQSSFGLVRFKLHAKLELNETEYDLLDRYGFRSSVLISVPQPGLFRNSFIVGFVSFVIAVPVIAFNFWREIGLGWTGVFCVSTLIAFAIAFACYHYFRETIYVKDLLHGRFFTCKSVCELARTEAYLQTITGYLRQVMESAKHWDGAESTEIETLPKDEARRAILSGPLF